MRIILAIAALLTVALTANAGPAAAQTPPAELGARYVPAPWWMREPVIASIGYVQTEVPSNRASFTATFQVVDKTAPEATKAAADKVRALSETLRAYGADKVRVETTFTMRPIYDQYRDKDGNLIDNQRADKIEKYEVNAVVVVNIRDTALVERAYATVLAARPTTTQPVRFWLEPDNATKTWLSGEAAKDAKRRAALAVENAGGRLGGVKVIDPTGRACQTDVLAGWPSYSGGTAQPTDVAYDSMPAVAAPAPPPPPAMSRATGGSQQGLVSEEELQRMQLTLQPPLQKLQETACVVYGLT